MTALEEAIQELYRVPLPQFITERKRLAGQLKGAGDAAAAKALLARKRPTISVWVVNQLYWHARDAFDAMLQTAERLREGDLGASGDHREAIATLRRRAASMLADAGHTPTEATLRRVTTTLAALAASGGFEPDVPGALAEDRDPPGFDAVGIPSGPVERPVKAQHKPGSDGHATDELSAARAKLAAAQHAHEQGEAARRAEQIAEKQRAEAERKRLAAERHRLEAALRTARAERAEHEREVEQLENQLATEQHAIENAQQQIDALERRLADLDDHA